MKKKPSIKKLQREIKLLESDLDKVTRERNMYRDFGADLFKVSAGVGKLATINSMWIMNRLASIYNSYGMPWIQWKKDE